MNTTTHGHLVDKEMAGNGYHGRCEYCGLALVTDLGYTSWKGTKCTPRPILKIGEVPEKIRSYASFRGMIFKNGEYINPFDKTYSLDELEGIINNLTKIS